MIKCNVTISGVVSRQAVKRANREGKSFSTFGVNVVIPATSGINKTIEVSVAKDGEEDLSYLTAGSRVEVSGVLTFHKNEDKLWFNLSATGINAFNAPTEDSIKGDMEFRGTLGKKDILAKADKKGKPFKVFSGYSSERIANATETEEAKYAFIWVRFVHFEANDTDWLMPSLGIDVKGELDVSAYNDSISLGCKVKEIVKWDKPQGQTNG